MGRIASTALASAFAAPALLLGALAPGVPAPGAPAAGAPAAGALATGTSEVPVAQAAASPTPRASGSPKPTQGATPPPPQHIVPAGPPPPAKGMPRPGANCLTQHGRRSLTGEPWAQRALDVSSVWDLTRGRGITVAVVDSGIDYTPQLVGRVSHTDLTGGNGEDCVPHGTLVSSIIAAGDARARGVPFYGMAPAARILSVRVQAQEGTSGQSTAAKAKVLTDIANGIRYAVNHGAKVINVSIQVSASYPALRLAVQYALRRNVVVVAAAGNDNPGGGQGPFYPASYPGVLSVNAVDQQGQLGSFDVKRTPVSVTAPGVNVAADYPGGFDPAANGTSFAAAFVSGEAALVRAAYPKLTGAQVVQRIIATAAGHTGAHTGAGMINPVQAVTAVLPSQAAVAPPQPIVSLPQRRAVDPVTRTVALSVTGGAIGVTALVAIAAAVLPRGSRRRWRPGLAGTAAAARAEATTAPARTAPARTPRAKAAPPEDPRADAAPPGAQPAPPSTRRTPSRRAWPGQLGIDRRPRPKPVGHPGEPHQPRQPRDPAQPSAATPPPATPPPGTAPPAARLPRILPQPPSTAPPAAAAPPRQPAAPPRQPELAEPAEAPTGAAHPAEAPAPERPPAPRQPAPPQAAPRQPGARHRRR